MTKDYYKILDIGCDAGYNLVPAPPAKTIPFIMANPYPFLNVFISASIQTRSIRQGGGI